MGLVTKAAFWGFLGLIALPSFYPQPEATQQGGTTISAPSTDVSVSPFEAVRFATGVAQDVRSVCDRDPFLCETGKRLADAALTRARDGARIAASLIGEGEETHVPDRLITGGTETVLPVPAERPTAPSFQ